MDSLSFESFRESCLTGVGSLQDRLKLFALRSANASEVERWSHAHTRHTPWSSSRLYHIHSTTTHTFLICFNVHLFLCYTWKTHRSKMDQHSSSVAGLLVTMIQNCQSSFRQTCKNTHAHANLQHMHHMYKQKHKTHKWSCAIIHTVHSHIDSLCAFILLLPTILKCFRKFLEISRGGKERKWEGTSSHQDIFSDKTRRKQRVWHYTKNHCFISALGNAKRFPLVIQQHKHFEGHMKPKRLFFVVHR